MGRAHYRFQLAAVTADLAPGERAAFFYGTGARVYRIDLAYTNVASAAGE